MSRDALVNMLCEGLKKEGYNVYNGGYDSGFAGYTLFINGKDFFVPNCELDKYTLRQHIERFKKKGLKDGKDLSL